MKAIATTRRWIACFAAFALIAFGLTFAFEIANPQSASAQNSVRPPAGAVNQGAGEGPQAGEVPGGVLGTNSNSETWRAIRKGIQGTVSIPDKKAGQLVQSEGDNWRAFRNGPLVLWSAIAIAVMIVLLLIFYLLRGRIMVEHGMSGRTIERFGVIERMSHWLLAVSFIILALTGLNITFGRTVLLPVFGKEIFSALAIGGKWLHNYTAFAFMVGLAMVIVLWLLENIPNRHDLTWIAKGGGMFTKGSHPPARKFNAGQKIIFWLVVLGGLSISISGLALLFPFQFSMFSGTFAFFNIFGTNLPTDLAGVQEMQLATLWHAIVAVFLTVVILAHIYIGTIGMEGAFDAMGTGEVDENWAKEHHSLWVKELKDSRGRSGKSKAKAAPAE